jgi:hypothetical protein
MESTKYVDEGDCACKNWGRACKSSDEIQNTPVQILIGHPQTQFKYVKHYFVGMFNANMLKYCYSVWSHRLQRTRTQIYFLTAEHFSVLKHVEPQNTRNCKTLPSNFTFIIINNNNNNNNYYYYYYYYYLFNCNWAVTRWQWLFNMYTNIRSWILINWHLSREGYMRST